ncbi:MAG: CapA family protein [Clostridia bacterium]|nr:CapA family protein [Clostridia bacterium]
MKRILSMLLLSVLFLSTACFDGSSGKAPEKITHLTSPAPGAGLEENDILRRPDSAAKPDDYASVTEPSDTDTGTPSTQPDDHIPPPPDSDEHRVSFVAVGDNIIHSAIIEDAKNHASGDAEYDFTYIYDNVRDVISAADVAFVNQETLLGGKELGYFGYPNFNGPQEAGDALVDAGFDIVCIATNHMCDMKEAGLRGTIDYWDKQPVTLVGGYRNAADYEKIRIHEKNGIRIAVLAYTYDPYTTNGMKLPSSSELITPIYNEDVIRRHVAAAKEVSDIVIVNMHWGKDSSFTVTNEQKKYAKLLADCGVDVIIGEHPHVLQPMEWMEGQNGHRTLLTYSLGNFLSTQYNDYFMVGGMLSFDIVKDSTGTRIETPMLVPTVTFYDVNRANLSVYFLDEFTEELASSHGTNAHQTTSLRQLRGYVTSAIDKQFLPASYQ